MVLLIALVLLIVTLLFENITTSTFGRVDTAEGRAVIAQAEAGDIAAIEARIQQLELQDSISGNAPAPEEMSLKEFFANNVVLGDSIAEGLVSYGVLNASSVVSRIGARLDDAETEVALVRDLNPQVLYVTLGMNDIRNDVLTKEQFISEYTELINTLQAILPNSKIIINSIFPVRRDVAIEIPTLSRIPEFNEALRDLAYSRQLSFLDNTSLVHEDLYEEDGIHFKASFYEGWAQTMREAAQ